MNECSAPVLEAAGLCAGYGRTRVVHGLDITVGAGEVVALLGPNGAGKTTSLLTISGLLEPMGGVIRLFGEPVEPHKHPHRMAAAGLGHVPEDRGLFRNLTVRQHLRLANTDPAVEARVLSRLPALERLQDRRVGLLSGGEQQMVAMARALVARPKVLLLDEMSLGLAPQVVAELLRVVRELADQDGVGTLLVEQHVRLALTTADRAYVMRQGRIVLEGQAADLLADPAALEATYLGRSESEELAV